MENRYKLIITNDTLYKEIELQETMNEITIGTQYDCDVKLRKNMFLSQFKITLKYIKEKWQIYCSDSIYFTNGIRKYFIKTLNHNDEFDVQYDGKGFRLFKLFFARDFLYRQDNYYIQIDIRKHKEIKIGGNTDCHIQVKDDYLGNDYMNLGWIDDELYYLNSNSVYGVLVNGTKPIEKSIIKDRYFISIAGIQFFYKNGALYTSDKHDIKCKELALYNVNHHTNDFEYPKYNRSPRIKPYYDPKELKVQQPSPKISKHDRILSTFLFFSLMRAVSFAENKKQYLTAVKEREENYTRYINDKIAMIELEREKELKYRREMYRTKEKSMEEIDRFGVCLFDRHYEDEDFLHVYLGTGDVEAQNKIKTNKPEFVDLDDSLSLKPEEIENKYKIMKDAPIYINFKDTNCIGVMGTKSECIDLLNSMTFDIMSRQFFNDVKLVYVLDDSYIEDVKWIRWLPHIINESLKIRNIACDEESKKIVLDYLFQVITQRENLMRNSESKVDMMLEHYVVFVSDINVLASHPLSRYYDKANDYHFTFVFLSQQQSRLPQECCKLIEMSNKQIIHNRSGEKTESFIYNSLPMENMEEIGRKLSCVYVDEVSTNNQLTKSISTYEMLGVSSVEEIDISYNYAISNVTKSMSAPLGVRAGNQVIEFDIIDGVHGPHGLVAGTTGSGKSEILQTYILSMALKYHPHEVTFLIIDFKGGAMANQFSKLPHMIGAITNIDGREINRSLMSIEAELKKREHIFKEYDVKNIKEYIRLFHEGKTKVALPHLIIIVDEFAEVKMEHPDFMEKLISAARIGRTLGVHLILATQKPAGVVDSQIWSNSKFKLCLKVQNKEDSNEVLKSPLAADIVEPGRAYLQVGNNEIFELFQSGYSGALVPSPNSSSENTFEIYERNVWGKRKTVYSNKKQKQQKEEITQQTAIIEYVSRYCKETSIKQLPNICLPPLEANIYVSKFDEMMLDDDGIYAILGMYDDPEKQVQSPLVINLMKNNVYIVGSSQSGKTTLLQTIAYSMISRYTPKQVNMYFIDCGNMILKNFEHSKHVGGVVFTNEEDKCHNLFKMIKEEISKRKVRFVETGVGNYAAYIEAGHQDLALYVVLIDNYSAFKEYFPQEDEQMNRLTQECIGAGVVFIITASINNALPYRTQSNFGEKLALNCNDAGEYSNLFGHCRKTPRERAGNGLCMVDRRILEYQAALFGKSKKESQRTVEQKEYIEKRNEFFKESAKKIPQIPELLELKRIMSEEPNLFNKHGLIPIGMDYETVDYVTLDFTKDRSLALLGAVKPQVKFIQNMLNVVSSNILSHHMRAYIIDDKQQSLKKYQNMGFVYRYVSNPVDGIDALMDFTSDINDIIDEPQDEIYWLIINNTDILKQLNTNKALSQQIADIIRNQDIHVYVLIANVDNQAIGALASETLKALKEMKQAISFMPLADMKMMEVPFRLKNDRSYLDGQGYYFQDSEIHKLKLFV